MQVGVVEEQGGAGRRRLPADRLGAGAEEVQQRQQGGAAPVAEAFAQCLARAELGWNQQGALAGSRCGSRPADRRRRRGPSPPVSHGDARLAGASAAPRWRIGQRRRRAGAGRAPRRSRARAARRAAFAGLRARTGSAPAGRRRPPRWGPPRPRRSSSRRRARSSSPAARPRSAPARRLRGRRTGAAAGRAACGRRDADERAGRRRSRSDPVDREGGRRVGAARRCGAGSPKVATGGPLRWIQAASMRL